MDDQSALHGAPNRNDTSIDKVHPSEFLEFATIAESGRIGTQHEPIQSEIKNATTSSTPERGNVECASVTTSNDDLFRGMSVAIPDLRRLSADARAHTATEHKMGFIEGCKLYPKAIAWSVLLSATIIMEGFDLTLVNSFQAFPEFRKAYGKPADADGRNHQISPAWQTGLQNGALAGEILGLFMNGWMVDRFGYQRTMVISLIWMCLFVFLAFFAFNIQLLLASQVLCGIPWGVFQTLSMTYAAEIMPIALRAYLLVRDLANVEIEDWLTANRQTSTCAG